MKYLLLNNRMRGEIEEFLPKDKDILKLALYFQNFSDSTRLKILACLSLCDMCVNDLSNMLNINQTTISHQLKGLKNQNLISFRREGKILIYNLINKDINEMMSYAINFAL